MKKIFKISILASFALFSATSCDYLDIVPDNTIELTNLFETRDKAYKAVTDAYSYFPDIEGIHATIWMAGDEFVERLDSEVADSRSLCPGNKLMRDWNNSSSPILNYWSGSGKANNLYEGIRICNLVINGLSPDIPNLSEEDYKDWIAQVKIMKAYYHYWLLKLYGPIIIADTNTEPADDIETIRRPRSTVDECFDYILGVIDGVLYNEDGSEKIDLMDERSDVYLGQVTRTIAKALKAEIWIMRASPLFNGNAEYYANFKNAEGKNYFPMEYKAEYWLKAYEAAEEAIAAAEAKGAALYKYTDQVPYWDTENYAVSEGVRYLYNHRYTLCDPWNSELIWGFSNVAHTGQSSIKSGGGTLMSGTQIRGYEDQPTQSTFSFQWISASMATVERFYTRNGVPIGEDKTYYPEADWYKLTTIPHDAYHQGLMQPDEQTVNIHLNREPRFYATLAVDRGYWRDYNKLLELRMRLSEFPGGRNTGHATDYYWTGMTTKKYVHPESEAASWMRMVFFPLPLIRLADLYLLSAEAYNEYYGPAQKVYDRLNAVRARTGLPKIEDVWADASIVNSVGKHLTQDGLRDIIHTERMIELMFEGKQFDDVRRWKRGDEIFSKPIQGWNAPDGATAETFYQVVSWQARTWNTPKSYLMPIPDGEINRNYKVDQNPGY